MRPSVPSVIMFLIVMSGCALYRAMDEEFPPPSGIIPVKATALHRASTQGADSHAVTPPVETPSTATDSDVNCEELPSPASQICCESWHELHRTLRTPDLIFPTLQDMAPTVTKAGEDVVAAIAANPTANGVRTARPWLPPKQEWEASPPFMHTLFSDCFGGPAAEPYRTPADLHDRPAIERPNDGVTILNH